MTNLERIRSGVSVLSAGRLSLDGEEVLRVGVQSIWD